MAHKINLAFDRRTLALTQPRRAATSQDYTLFFAGVVTWVVLALAVALKNYSLAQ